MKRKINYLIAAAMVLTVMLFACRKEYVYDILITGVNLTTDKGATTATLDVNATLLLKVTITPEDATNTRLVWKSSNPTIATVVDGLVTAKSTGTVTISATTEDGSEITANFIIIVSVPTSGITLSPTTLSMVEGESRTLTATISPANATDKTVTWASSDEKVATVVDGIVTAKSAGATSITATTQDNKVAICTVTVSASIIPVSGVTLNESTLTIEDNAKSTLVATVWPANATNKKVIWTTSNAGVASVSNGEISAHLPGTVTITATTEDGNKTATCTVTVVVSIADIMLNKDKMTLTVGNTEKLTATVLPPNASNPKINWRSSNNAIATVTNEGEVKAIAPGIASVVASTEDGGKTAICIVTVEALNIPVASVTLPSTLLINGSTETKLTASILPIGATNQTVAWTSSDPAVVKNPTETGLTVDIKPEDPAPGVTTARTTTITVTTADGSKIANCVVTVNYVAVTGVTLNKTTLSLTVGATQTLIATVAPANASNQKITWVSSDPSVTVVPTTGLVVAALAGTATITATSDADSTKTATCAVTVTP